MKLSAGIIVTAALGSALAQQYPRDYESMVKVRRDIKPATATPSSGIFVVPDPVAFKAGLATKALFTPTQALSPTALPSVPAKPADPPKTNKVKQFFKNLFGL